MVTVGVVTRKNGKVEVLAHFSSSPSIQKLLILLSGPNVANLPLIWRFTRQTSSFPVLCYGLNIKTETRRLARTMQNTRQKNRTKTRLKFENIIFNIDIIKAFLISVFKHEDAVIYEL